MNTAIVIITCNRFNQVWGPFFTLLNKYWNDCPYPIYFITDFGQIKDLINITIGKDMGFSNNLMYGLNQIKEQNIIYFQEDYLATDYFNTKKIIEFEKYHINHKTGCLRLCPCPGPSKKLNKELGILQIGDEYRVSTQTAIWNKELLLRLLKPNETGGQFEINGTKRSYLMPEQFLSVYRGESPTPYYITGVVKGKWQDGALDLLRKEKINMSNITKVIK